MTTIVDILKAAKVGTPPSAAKARATHYWHGTRSLHKQGRASISPQRKADRAPGACTVRTGLDAMMAEYDAKVAERNAVLRQAFGDCIDAWNDAVAKMQHQG